MRAWRARNPGYMARKGREHRERRRFGVSLEPLPEALGITNSLAHTVESKSRRDRAYGERAKQLLLDLPVGGLALFTDGGSNKNRTQTGWGVCVVKKNLAGPRTVVAEFFGPVSTGLMPVIRKNRALGGVVLYLSASGRYTIPF